MPTKPKGQGKKGRTRGSKAESERQRRVKTMFLAALPTDQISQETQVKQGRPSGYNNIIANEILLMLAEGNPLTTICKRQDMPGYRTVMDWRKKYPDFDRSYARAREDGVHHMAEDTIAMGDAAIADDDPKKAQAYQVAIRARQWFASKLIPNVYGENVNVHHGGGIQIQELRGIDDESLAALEEILKAAAIKEAKAGRVIDGEVVDPALSAPLSSS